MKSITNPKKRTGRGKAKKIFRFKSKVIIWREGTRDGSDIGAWRFARMPEGISAKIKKMQKGRLRRGWGAIYAKTKVGKSEWVTSIFPDRHSATYILPLKKQIRYEENLYDGALFNFSISIWF
jgi:hypothetical protein